MPTTVDHVNYKTVIKGLRKLKEAVSITLRNPWGGSNPFVTITPAEVQANLADSTTTTG